MRVPSLAFPARPVRTAVLILAMAASAWVSAEAPSIFVIPIRGNIEPSTVVFVRRNSEAALGQGADVLVFDIDTFGGRVDSALRVSAYIGSIRDARTIAYVRSGPESLGVSWSAGALIALSTSEIYMAPGTSMGAAAPVIAGADGQTQGAGEKTVAAVRSQMAALAEKNGHPTALALAMVDVDVEVVELRVDGETRVVTAEEATALEKSRPGAVERLGVVSPKGKLLSLTAGEAERYGLSSGTVTDMEALATLLGAEGRFTELMPSAADQAIMILTSGPVQTLLILIALVALFLEINSPGFGIPGTVAVVAFFTIFGANALMGQVGSLEIILFLLGMALIAVELFILPGFGVAGISGIVLIGTALILSMQDFVLPTVDWEWGLLGRNFLTVGSGLLAGIAGIGVLALAGPKIKLFERMTLKTVIEGTASGDPGVDSALENRESPSVLEGRSGVARTTLRPSGRAEIDGTLYSVETDGMYVPEGTTVRVVKVQGSRILVAPDGRQSARKRRGAE